MTANRGVGDGAPDAGLAMVMGERRQLINLGYRLLGSLTEAEDAVQETYARWYAMTEDEQAAILSPGAWLTTVASRICLNQLGSARTRRETYVGEWVPEPLPEGRSGRSGHVVTDPADLITLDESINMAFLVILDSMTPAERVAFILHDVFRYPYADIAAVVGRSPAACRQLASSARRRIRQTSGAATSTLAVDQQAVIVRDFKRAWEAMDIRALVEVLDPEATAIADGGGLVSAVLLPTRGADEIARGCVEIARRVPELTVEERLVNGRPGLVAQQDGVIVSVVAFAIADGRITHMWAVLNPEKIRLWNVGGRVDRSASA